MKIILRYKKEFYSGHGVSGKFMFLQCSNNGSVFVLDKLSVVSFLLMGPPSPWLVAKKFHTVSYPKSCDEMTSSRNFCSFCIEPNSHQQNTEYY